MSEIDLVHLFFLKVLETKIIGSYYSPKIIKSLSLLLDPINLLRHRKGLSLQLRNSIVSSSLFSYSSLMLGLVIKEINLSFILDSCQVFWTSLNLELEEFYFLLIKEFFYSISKMNLVYFNMDLFYLTSKDILKILMFFEFWSLFHFKLKEPIVFYDDNIILNTIDNLTTLVLFLTLTLNRSCIFK